MAHQRCPVSCAGDLLMPSAALHETGGEGCRAILALAALVESSAQPQSV